MEELLRSSCLCAQSYATAAIRRDPPLPPLPPSSPPASSNAPTPQRQQPNYRPHPLAAHLIFLISLISLIFQQSIFGKHPQQQPALIGRTLQPNFKQSTLQLPLAVATRSSAAALLLGEARPRRIVPARPGAISVAPWSLLLCCCSALDNPSAVALAGKLEQSAAGQRVANEAGHAAVLSGPAWLG